MFQLWSLRRRTVPPPPPGLRVDVFITTYNEDVSLLRQTVRGALRMRYPHRTFILDDGRRAAVRQLARELGCGYITRPTNEHAKAGNWNNAFRQTDADFIATFDADHVPRPAFLERTLGIGVAAFSGWALFTLHRRVAGKGGRNGRFKGDG